MARRRSQFDIEVTEGDIEVAHVGDSFNCVVAEAIKRQIPEARKIEVDLQTIRWSDDNGRHVFLTPFEAQGYVVAFDAGDEMHPFWFRLKNAIPALQTRAVTDAAKAAQKSRGKITRERNAVKRAEAVLADPDAPEEKVAAARDRLEKGPERVAAAEKSHEDLKDYYHTVGQSISAQRVSEATRPGAPRVFRKLKRRAYGARILRVNQESGRKHYVYE